MQSLVKYAPLFATPFSGSADAIATSLSLAYLAAVRQRVEQALAENASCAPAIFRIDSLLRHSTVHAWRPECGMALAALQRGSPYEAALQLGLAHVAVGHPVEIVMPLNTASRLFLEGHLWEVNARTCVIAKENTLTIETNDGRQRARFYKDDGRWTLEITATTLPTMNWTPLFEADVADVADGGYIVHSTAAMTEDGFAWPSHQDVLPGLSQNQLKTSRIAAQDVRAAQQCVKEFAPNYAAWITRLRSGFLLCDNRSGEQLKSGSSLSQPGLICLSEGACPVMGGELIVHESSHQHLMLYDILMRLTNGGDENTYYSPLKGARRDIGRLLLAAHATANILLYFSEIQSNGVNIERYGRNIRFHRDNFEQMRGPISESNGLTSAGELFFLALTTALDARDRK